MIVCPTCKNSFIPTKRKKKYCSIKCCRKKERLIEDPIERFFRAKIVRLRSNASRRKIEFNLNWSDLLNQYLKQNKRCFYTKKELLLTYGAKEYKVCPPNQLSVDRINSNLGYTKENIVLCCYNINNFKGDVSLKDFQIMLKELNNQTIQLKIKKLYEDSQLPTSGTHGSAGYDLYVHRIEDYGTFIKVFTGIAVQPEKEYFNILAPRSSIFKKGLMLYNNIGIIDSDYTGEIIGVFIKTDDFKSLPEKGERVLQLIPQKRIGLILKEVESLDETERGTGGYGSTGN